jgi:two-component system LytT family response regulator
MRTLIGDNYEAGQATNERIRADVGGVSTHTVIFAEDHQKSDTSIAGSDSQRFSTQQSASDAASSSQSKHLEQLALREHGRIFFQKVFEIECFTSAANYVFVHCGARTHRMRSTMHELEAKLDPKQFARVHRCTIINIDYVRDFRPLPRGDYLIRLHNGKELKMSRNYRPQFRNAIAALDKQ